MIYYILFLHWLADFVFQSRHTAENKSKDWEVLAKHVWLYVAVLTIGLASILTFQGEYDALGRALTFATLNGGCHFVTDAVTSRVSAYAYKNGRMTLFWHTIGFDQFLHVVVLCATLSVL